MWKKLDNGNYVLDGGTYFISYIEEVSQNIKEMDEIINFVEKMAGIKNSGKYERGGAETALVIRGLPELGSKNLYKILAGDFGLEYENCKTLDEALAVFESKKVEFGHKASTLEEDRVGN